MQLCLGDIGVPVSDASMNFAASFETFIGALVFPFDPRNNVPRIGRVLIARGRDAAEIAIVTTFGPNMLRKFSVYAAEISPNAT